MKAAGPTSMTFIKANNIEVNNLFHDRPVLLATDGTAFLAGDVEAAGGANCRPRLGSLPH